MQIADYRLPKNVCMFSDLVAHFLRQPDVIDNGNLISVEPARLGRALF